MKALPKATRPRRALAVILLASTLLCAGCQSPAQMGSPAAVASQDAAAVFQKEEKGSASSALPEETPEPAESAGQTVEPGQSEASAPDGENPAASSNAGEPSSCLLDAPLLMQLPELPVGCEITTLAMALNDAGYSVSKTELSDSYLPKSSNWYYVGDVRYGPDMRVEFAGDPRYEGGACCDAPAIVTAAQRYLSAVGAANTVVNLTGSEPQALYDELLAGRPVVTWVTIGMVDRVISGGWYVAGTSDYVQWGAMDHCALLTGFSDTTVYFNDPLAGAVSYPRDVFESVFRQRGQQAVVIR